jgi:pteridine reductase
MPAVADDSDSGPRPLEGKAALITGGAVRVGRAIALALCAAGADIAVHFRSHGSEARRLCDEVMAQGRRAWPIAGDLTDPEACDAVARGSLEQLGRLDALVHSAASFERLSLEETDAAAWDAAMDLNARAGFLLARRLAGELRARHGRIVLISDFFAHHPVRGYLAHAVSKSAVEGLVRALAVELAPEVSVNGIAPGTVLVPSGTSKEDEERWAKKVPLRRNGSPEDIGRAAVYLCSGSGFTTGQILRVDGGRDLA